jgi:glucokinase
MLSLRTITATEMRVINRSAILELIRREIPISRTAIAKQLEVSLPTVMRIVDQLVDEGLVYPFGDSEWSGGRRRALLAFNADGQVVVGVDLGAMKMRGSDREPGRQNPSRSRYPAAYLLRRRKF